MPDTIALPHDDTSWPPRTICSYGMGVDSTAILLRWLTEPDHRDFDLEELIVITAMTGHEFERTGELVAEHILPRLREAGVRHVQLARGGRLRRDGVVVLEDTRAPHTVHLGGAYTLLEELEHAVTVPQYASGRRRCSQKYKGWPIDTWLEGELAPEEPFTHVMGYAVGEERRAKKDMTYASATRRPRYPLLEWGWDRADCVAYIAQVTGVDPWPKSCCTFCPFSGGRRAHIERLATFEPRAIEALMLEHMALAFNPRQGLFASGRSLRATLAQAGHGHLLEAFEAHLDALDWQLYEVRRLWRSRSSCLRSTRVLDDSQGARAEVEQKLRDLTLDAPEVDPDEDMQATCHLRRIWHGKHDRDDYPLREAFIVAAPARYGPNRPSITSKARASFEAYWLAAAEGSCQVEARHQRRARGEQLLPFIS